MSGLPAVVSILQLGTGTLSSSAVIPASMTVAGVATTLGVTISQIATTTFGALPTGGATGAILNKTSGTNFDTQWSSITQFVTASTGITVAGSTTVALSLSTTTGLSALGVAGTATAAPAAIVGTAGQVLRINDAGTALAFGAVNLASSAAVTGVLSVPNGGSNTSTLTANGVVYGNGTSTVGITAAPATSTLLAASGTAPFFSAAPTLGTSLTLPVVIGGALTTSVLELRATSGTGAGAEAVKITGGVNGGTRFASFASGSSSIGANAPTSGIFYDINQGGAVANPDATNNPTVRILSQNGSVAELAFQAFGNANVFRGFRANATSGTPTTLAANDTIFNISAIGYTGGGFSAQASGRIAILAAESFNATSAGGYITFSVIPTGSLTIAETMRLTPAGGIANGTTTDPGAGSMIATGKHTLLSGTALSSTAAAVLLFGSVASFGMYVGTGVPAVIAGTGSLYLRNDGASATTRMYVNTNGSTTWTAVNTVS